MNTPSIEITRASRGNVPPLPFEKIKDTVLGKKYSLSLVFTTTKYATELHIKYKKEPGPANILSFPYSQHEGEMFIHLGTIRAQARAYGRTYYEHLTFMFIHGLLHLKGYHHGTAMEKEEEKFYKKFKTAP